jgi:hypothetical protein
MLVKIEASKNEKLVLPLRLRSASGLLCEFLSAQTFGGTAGFLIL